MNSVRETADAQGETRPAEATAAKFESLSWLSNEDRPLDWNGPICRTFTRIPREDLDCPIIAHFERAARLYGSHIAVTDSNTSLSFSELWRGLGGLAAMVQAETKTGDLIGIAMPTCCMLPLAMLACLAAGRPFVILDPHYPNGWLIHVLEDAQPALILVSAHPGREDVLLSVGAAAPAARLIHLAALPQPAPPGWRPAELDVDQPACILFTSGSSGRPKGIVNSQRNLMQRVAQSINAAHINSEDRFLTLASLCTIVGVRDTLTALLAGARVRLIDPQRAGAREILDVIRAEAITILFGFPALLRSVLALCSGPAGDTLRLVRVGGDTTLWSDIDLLRAWLAPTSAIQLIYAATEAPMMQWFVDDSFRSEEAGIPIGYPLPGNRLALIDEYGRNARPGEVGELIVGSPYVALGRWVRGQCVKGHCGDGGGTIPPSRIFRTGDLARQRPDGMLERLGRKDRQVKIRGTRVDLEGVEAALRRHPLVHDSGALIRTGGDGSATLVAYVCARTGAPGGLIAELNSVMRSVPSPMRPGRIYLIDRIPRLPSSKLDLSELAFLDRSNVQNEATGVAGTSEDVGSDGTAATVARIWEQVLNTSVHTAEDDFFEAGGDSLKAIRFVNGIEKALGLELPLTLINESTTFFAFCQALREHRTGRYVPLVCLKPCGGPGGGSLPPLFFVHGLGGNVSELFAMARRMTYAGPVFAIQARGLAGEGPPHGSVDAMATEYLTAVKARQPQGPYYLCGYSFGGLVAFEMARRLAEAGDEVGLVGLFDTMMSPVRWPMRAWLSIPWRRLVLFARAVRVTPARMWLAAIRKVGRAVPAADALPTDPERPPLPDFLKSSPSSVMRVAAGALIASARYRPAFYRGELTLFSPRGREPGLPSLQSIWRKHARTLTVVETIGTHWTMLTAPNAEHTAACLTNRLPANGQVRRTL